MVGYALSGFVDGFFRGRDVKHSWEDRKLDRERQTRLDALDKERHDAIMAKYGREAADWDRANRMREAELGVFERAVDAANAGVQTTNGAASGAEPPGPRVAPAAGPVELGLDMPPIPRPSRFADTMTRTSPADELAASARDSGGKTARRAPDEPPGSTLPNLSRDVAASMLRRGDPSTVAAMSMPPGDSRRAGPPLGVQPGAPTEMTFGTETLAEAVRALGADAVGYGQGRVDPRLARAVGLGVLPQPEPERAAPRGRPDGTIVVPAPSAAIADELYQQGPVGVRYIEPSQQIQPSPAGGLVPDAAPSAAPAPASRQVYVPGRGIVTVTEPTAEEIAQMTRDRRADAAAQWDSAILDPMRRLGGAMHGNPTGGQSTAVPAPQTGVQTPPGRVLGATAPPPRPANLTATAPAAAEAPQLDPSNPVPPMRAAVPKGASQTEANTAAGVADAINREVPAPASDAARAAVAELGVAPGDKVTPAQYDRASKSFMDRYLEVGAPMVVEHYMKTGQIEKAAAFMNFIDGAQARENMKDWGVAAAAISVGDIDKALNTVLDAYQRMDYFADDTEIVRDKSGVLRDKDGNASGVKLVFRDPKTGTTFEQVYENMDDVISLGMTLMDPMTSFEKLEERAAAQREAALGAQEKAIELAESTQKRIDEFAKMIHDGSKQVDGTFAVTPEQALQQARSLILGAGDQSANAGGEPELYRLPGR